MSFSLEEIGRLANVGGDILYGKKIKKDRTDAERLIASLTNEAQDKAKGDTSKQNWLDVLKFGSKFLGPMGPLISTGLSIADIIGDAKRAKNITMNLNAKDRRRISGSKYKDTILQNLSALDSQVKGAAKGQLKSSLLNNLLSIGMNVGSLPGAGELSDKAIEEAAKEAGVDNIATETAKKSGIFDNVAKKFKDKDWSELFGDKSKLNPPQHLKPGTIHTPDMLKNIDLSGVDMPDADLGRAAKFLTGQGKGPSLFDQWKKEPWFEALIETIPGAETAVSLGKYPIGKTSATLGDAYLPGSSILNRMMTQYGDATSPAMPTYQRKSLRRRIA